MTPQEMIQSAAKAAGFLYDPTRTGEDGTLVGRYRNEPDGPTYVFNPVTDMEDAVVMASMIGLRIEYTNDQVWCHYGANVHISESLNQGVVQATCLVLTRVAAEVGKQYL